METKKIFQKLWNNYAEQNPSAKKIHQLLENQGEKIINDHIAFRTFNDPRINIDVLANIFINVGYVEKGQYRFDEKKLIAKHYEFPDYPEAPKVFISQLMLEEISNSAQNILIDFINKIPNEIISSDKIIFSENNWNKPSYKIYNILREESEYAAWVYVYGFRSNHFTVLANNLKKYNSLQELNSFLKNNGFILNNSGGEIKGTPSELLEQSSTMADIITVNFIEGSYKIPACYYEFAKRYMDNSGKNYSGFIAKSADKIFESTNYTNRKY